MMKTLLHLLIFAAQSAGVVLIGIGLNMIWVPLGWIYSGAVAFIFGHLVYLAMESEESKK